MGSLLANRGLLLTAWIVVLALLGGALAFALLQPPPPPPRAAPVTLALELPAAPQEPETPPQPAPAQPAPPEPAPPEPAPSEPAAQAPAEAAPEPLAETPPAELPAEEKPAEEPAGEPEAPAQAAEDQPEEAAPAAEPAPEAPEAAEGHDAAPQGEAAATPPAEEAEQQAAIPVPPPAPEQLAYWERYRQPFNLDDPRPRIAVVLTGLGLSDSATEAAINKLPSAVTLSFSPYARDLERWIALARARGHEVMLDLPMEPATFPNEDPGPQGLLTGLDAEENLNRLDWVLSRGSAYVGLASVLGSRFTTARSALEPVLKEVKDRGLIFLDRRTTDESLVSVIAEEIGLPTAINSRSIDERQASRIAIDARLAQIERIALSEGYAVAMAQPYPVTLERLADWATELTARGFVIAPITALADRQKLP